MWNYERRTELWDLNNRVTRAAGGPDCQASSFRDLKEICNRASILMLDHQRRDNATGFEQNGDTGKRVPPVIGDRQTLNPSVVLWQDQFSKPCGLE
jgi:hypothetical protein